MDSIDPVAAVAGSVAADSAADLLLDSDFQALVAADSAAAVGSVVVEVHGPRD